MQFWNTPSTKQTRVSWNVFVMSFTVSRANGAGLVLNHVKKQWLIIILLIIGAKLSVFDSTSLSMRLLNCLKSFLFAFWLACLQEDQLCLDRHVCRFTNHDAWCTYPARNIYSLRASIDPLCVPFCCNRQSVHDCKLSKLQVITLAKSFSHPQ
jgi:hypothetical protein